MYDLVGSIDIRSRSFSASALFQYILLCSFSPCTRCANAIIYSKNIDAVIYDKVYNTDTNGLGMLHNIMPVLTVRTIKEIVASGHRGELSFIKRWCE